MKKFLDAFLWTAANLRLDNKTDQLCCVFARVVFAKRFGDAVAAKSPIALWHNWPETGDQWGPVTAAVGTGMATRVDAPVRGKVHIVQTWSNVDGVPFTGYGHTFYWYESADGSGGIRFDSADKREPDGGITDTREDGPATTQTEWSAIVKNRTFRLAALGGVE